MSPYCYEKKRRKKDGIKIYVAIILLCSLLSIGLNLAYEKGSSVLDTLRSIPWKGLDHDIVKKLRSELGKDLDLEDVKRLKEEYEEKTDPEELERIKEKFKRSIHPEDLERLKQVFKQVPQEQ